MFLKGKVKNGKYPEAETWHPQSIDGRSCYRLCENFWWTFGTVSWGQCRPSLGPTFLLKSFDIPKEPNFKILKHFSINVLLGYHWSKFQQDRTMFGRIRAKKNPKRAISWMLNQYKKLFNFIATYAILMKLSTDLYLNKVLIRSCDSFKPYDSVNQENRKFCRKC